MCDVLTVVSYEQLGPVKPAKSALARTARQLDRYNSPVFALRLVVSISFMFLSLYPHLIVLSRATLPALVGQASSPVMPSSG